LIFLEINSDLLIDRIRELPSGDNWPIVIASAYLLKVRGEYGVR